jgi:putative ABC transport system ATP-binding protein
MADYGFLDSASGTTVIGLLRELNSDGTTVVVITHDQAVASTMSRQITMRDGVITC